MSISTSWSSDRSPRPPPTRWPATSTEPEPPMAADPDGPTAWIVVSPDLDPLVSVHLEHAGGTAVGEGPGGDECGGARAWAPGPDRPGGHRLRSLRHDLLGGRRPAPVLGP